jgi:hypothetical protein
MPPKPLGDHALTPAEHQARRKEHLLLTVAALRLIAEKARNLVEARQIAREALASFSSRHRSQRTTPDSAARTDVV